MSKSRELVKQVILEGTPAEKRALFQFKEYHTEQEILLKFKFFTRGLYPRYFQSASAPFHDEMVLNYIKSYLGKQNYINIAFRGSAKTSLKKLFDVFVLLNDTRKKKRHYIKILSKDIKNSKQIVTDVYNLIVEARPVYGDVFEKQGDIKREETMSSFTLSNGIKYSSGTVGQTQRGHVQDAYRPDWLWFEDIEDRDSIRSAVITGGIIDKSDEAIQGIAQDGNWVITANYISDAGSVQWFLDRVNKVATITPIVDDEGNATWEYFKDKIDSIKEDAQDWAGEYLCDPQASQDKFFNPKKQFEQPLKTVGSWHIFRDYNPSHRYGMGADVSEGLGLDSSTVTIIDFNTGETVATYVNNTIAPDIFAYEMARMAREYGECVIAPERNNHGHATLVELKKIYSNIYVEVNMWGTAEKPTNKLGWHTNAKSKPNMLFDFKKACDDGLVQVLDERLYKELKAYSHNDLAGLVGLSTRHFDLLISACIAWQMKDTASYSEAGVSQFVEHEELNENL